MCGLLNMTISYLELEAFHFPMLNKARFYFSVLKLKYRVNMTEYCGIDQIILLTRI
jgi:hypothetical protein